MPSTHHSLPAPTFHVEMKPLVQFGTEFGQGTSEETLPMAGLAGTQVLNQGLAETGPPP